ncbi:MAG: G-D-S-L family lipolytic protein [Pseudopedobacter saltans]|uniref:G-D-S-L family lipolytic protein n=1 Tax=Pseudopedobacter saltans TaxID=151895 RepID=A0A2W5H1K5_9SPHI|nr:MAG: G-D-S-L family lipolytic protein [Pseudopedobacter saltans]
MKLYLICFLLLVCKIGLAQNTPFYHDIQQFKQKDSLHFPEKNEILFIGSSSFTKWTDVQEYFPNYKIINRGFGGSSLPDVIRYANDIIYPYQPKQVVIYCGDNDFAVSDTVTADMVIFRTQTLFGMIRTILPNATIDYVSIKYSPSRSKMWPKIKDANKGIASFFKKQSNAAFIDITTPMKIGKQQVDESLFLEDMLHMKPTGYKIWQKAIEPYLIK